MDLTAENCRKQFLLQRKNLRKKVDKSDFNVREDVAIDLFNEVCMRAANDNPIAQDLLAYLFKKGFYDIIPVNYEKYMQWEILAAANGNQFALEKLTLFLSFPLNEIVISEDFHYILTRNELDNSNFNYVVGRLICEAIADELRLTPEKLIKDPIVHAEFDPKIMRVFDKARNYAIPKILNYLRS